MTDYHLVINLKCRFRNVYSCLFITALNLNNINLMVTFTIPKTYN